MPRRSPYAIELSEEGRRALQRIAERYSSPYREVMRAKIVLYAAQVLSNEETASRLDLPRQVVSKWRKRFYEEGMPGLAEAAAAGPARGLFPHRSWLR